MHNLLAFIIGLFLFATLFRVDFFFYLLYLLFGVYFFSRLWAERALSHIAFEHEYSDRAFLGERIQVKLHIRNRGMLPLPWLRVHESLPLTLKSPGFFQCVLSLLPHEAKTLAYELDCRRRGYYRLGPLLISSGDLFGMRGHERWVRTSDALVVYPQIVPLTSLGLPAQTPFGVIAAKQRVFEDPARMIGVRDYQSGDSIRHIHWKTTAAKGSLQVKRLEPAISIEAQIFLNLNKTEYTMARVATATELGIVAAASIANFLVERRQKVGLSCNGSDPLNADARMIQLRPGKGRDQLMHLLDLLARIQTGEAVPFVDLLRQANLQLTWGGTAIIISADADDALFENMLLMKRWGFHIVLVLTDPQTPFGNLQQRAKDVSIRAYEVWQESDLDVWR